MGVMKPFFPLLVLLLFFVSYFALPEFSRIAGKFEISLNPLLGSGNRGSVMKKVLKEASMEDKRVILTLVNSPDHSSVVKLFLESFRVGHGTARLLNHLIILVPDSKSFRFCKSLHRHCYDLSTMGEINRLLGSSGRVVVERKRHELFQEALGLGYSFIYTDPDTLWFRNPYSHISIFDAMAVSQKYISDSPYGPNVVPDGGFFYMSSHEMAFEFMKIWNMMGTLYPNSTTESTLEKVLNDEHGFLGLLGMNVKYLDMDDFGDFCRGSVYLSRIHVARVGCGAESGRKIGDLELLLDSWRNYTSSVR